MPEAAALEDVLLDSEAIERLLHFIVGEWQAVPEQWRPWGVWITLHAPLPASVDMLSDREMTRSVRAAWFLKDGIPQPRSIWEFIRFIVVHSQQPWNMRRDPVPDAVFSTRRHEIGLAAFAAFIDSPEIYLDTVWGGLWGRGRKVIVNVQGQVEERQLLWIS